MSAADLEVRGLGCSLGSFRVLDDISLVMRAGSRHGVIGPNGAGKSTFFNVITGVIRSADGSVQVAGEDISRRRPDQIARKGVVRTFQTPRVLARWTVAEQILFAAEQSGHSRRTARERARQAMEATSLTEVSSRSCAGLSSLERRRLALAGCLAHEPRVVLLDEPTAGLDEAETQQFAAMLRKAHGEFGFTVGLVEHKLSFLMTFCDEVTVLDAGTVIARGEPAEVARDSAVIEAYLGTESEAS